MTDASGTYVPIAIKMTGYMRVSQHFHPSDGSGSWRSPGIKKENDLVRFMRDRQQF